MKNKYYLLLFIVFSPICHVIAQQGMWTYVKGDTTFFSAGVFGIQGVSSTSNQPPALCEAASWTDTSGNFWIFGGGFFWNSNQWNALWKYDPDSNQWTWIKGSNLSNDTGMYGIQAVPSALNEPPSRSGASYWTDHNGNLWLYGGYSGLGNIKRDDLWRYNMITNEWTWMKGSNAHSHVPVYGIKGLEDSLNTPGSRFKASSNWVDTTGNLWLYGGSGNGYKRDLWKYIISSNNWVWMAGDSLYDTEPVYGVQGIADTNVTPGCRGGASSWTDTTGSFWYFGGYVTYWDSNSNPYGGVRNDIWKFNPNTLEWTWVWGPSVYAGPGNYNSLCSVSTSDQPKARGEASHATDACGNFWLIGGGTSFHIYDGTYSNFSSDTWKFNPYLNQWKWANNSAAFAPGSFITMGIPDSANHPNSRRGHTIWTGRNGGIYLYSGGWTDLSGGDDFYFNDLWKFTPDTSCIACEVYGTGMLNGRNADKKTYAYPNPSHDNFDIVNQDEKEPMQWIKVYNAFGSNLIYIQFNSTTKNVSFGNELAPGIYFAEIKFRTSIKKLKLIKL